MTARLLEIKSDGELFLDVSAPAGERLCSLTVEPHNLVKYNEGHLVCIPHDAVKSQTAKLYDRWNTGRVSMYFYNLTEEQPEDMELPQAYVIAGLIACNISSTADAVFSDIDCSYGSIKAVIRPLGIVPSLPDCDTPGVDLKNRGEISLIIWAGRKPQRCQGKSVETPNTDAISYSPSRD